MPIEIGEVEIVDDHPPARPSSPSAESAAPEPRPVADQFRSLHVLLDAHRELTYRADRLRAD